MMNARGRGLAAVAGLVLLTGSFMQASADDHSGVSAAVDLTGAARTATGSFVGASGHETTGSVSVYRTQAGWVVGLDPDFRHDGAPDPVVGLGAGGEYDPASKLGPLRSNTGDQSYALPANVDIGDYQQVYIWCEEFAVPLGVADLTPF